MNKDKLAAEYFKKSFFSVDGLWFLKTEADGSFEQALDIDAAVWAVLPKIQARTLQELLGLEQGLSAYRKGLDFKLAAEGFDYEMTENRPEGFSVEIKRCPWYAHLKKSGRLNILPKIAEKICPLEITTFARAFGDGFSVQYRNVPGDALQECRCFIEAKEG